jgi:sulfotransferase family protein
MSQILNQIDGVYSLSEPDVFTDLSYLRRTNRSRDDELTQVLKACTLLLSPRGNQKRPAAVALKFRSQAIELSDLMQDSFPDARNIFMYRNAASWAQSVFRFLQRLNYPNELSRHDAMSLFQGLTGEDPAYVEPYMDEGRELFYFSDLLAPAWTSYLDRYMAQYERGVPFYTLRYEDLNDRREESLKATFDYCGMPAAAVEQAMQGFEADSQAGTEISRDVRADDLTSERMEQFLDILSRHPRFNQPDFILPDSRDGGRIL